jgi:EamA-like transporter family.
MKSSRNLFPTYIAAIIAVFLWGFSFIWTNILIKENIPIYTFIFIRLSIAGLLLLLTAKITKKLQKIDPADFKWFFAMAFAEPFIYFIGESFGMKATGSPTISAIIIATIPIFCLIYERFISNIHISPLAIFGIIITIPGIIMAASESGASNSIEHLYGIALLFLAVFGAVGFAITTKN